mmetsp:Transcript_11433/g.21942  ORF Transcript_11433/g.21942 Transcript_11433/m.21942 type:complete len:368 (-) Transcript_11433:36-1139(-)
MLGHVDGGSLTGISSVLLEGESEESNLLSGDGVEHRLDHLPGKAVLLVVVDLDNLVPVLSDLLEAEALAEVHEVQDILLEARSAETDRSVEEPLANPLVLADGVANFLDISAGGFAKLGDGVDGGDTLGKESVSNKLGELRGPEVGGDDPVLRHPVGVDIDKLLDCLLAKLGGHTANEHAIRHVEVFHCGTLGEELRVGEHLEVDLAVVRHQHLAHGVGGTHRKSGLLNDDFGPVGDFGDVTGGELPVFEVSSASSANAVGLRRGVNGNEDDFAFADSLVDLGGEEEILSADFLYNRIESRLVDREVVRVPPGNLPRVDVDDVDLDIRALEGDGGHGWATDIASADTADLGFEVSHCSLGETWKLGI